MSEDDAEVNYLRELVLSNASVWGLVGVVGAAALVSIPFGLAPAAALVLGFVGVEGIAAVMLPDSPVFRAWVDRKKRRDAREQARSALTERVGKLRSFDDPQLTHEIDSHLGLYDRMRERLETLRGVGSLPTDELEKLDDVTVDFLRLLYARVLFHQRLGDDPHGVTRQLRELERAIDASDSVVDRRRLEQAKASLDGVAAQRARLPARIAAAKAQLIAMSESFEDLYHRVTADPAGNVGDFLEQTVARLSIEEELSSSVDEELDALTRARRARGAQSARAR